MDTFTHGLFGYTLYKIVKKDEKSKKQRYALLFTALVGSQAPDIDVVANLTETGQIMQQMWHRGLTHSIFLVPFWAWLIYILTSILFKVKEKRLYFVGLFAVFWHDTIDLFNAWGTGYFEPFSSIRITIGTIPIVDFVFWILFLVGFLINYFKKSIPSYMIYRLVAIGMLAHFSIQTVQGLIVEHQAQVKYHQTELTASFIPWQFEVIGKNGAQIDIYQDSLFSEPKHIKTINSKENADLTPLFQKNPKAKVLYEWSPFVAIIDNSTELGIYDPRFFRDGKSFLIQTIHK